MNKIEKVHPVTPSVVSNRVVISNKVFRDLINTINSVVETTNSIIESIEVINDNIVSYNNRHTNSEILLENQTAELRTAINSNKERIQALASAIQNLSNIQ